VRRARSGVAGVAAGLLLVASLGCRSTTPVASAPAPHTVRYRLTWAADDVAVDADGSWEVTTDTGYRVRITRGWVTSYSMELVECPRTAAAYGAAWLPALGPDAAWAGHNAGTPNPAAIRPMQVESLTNPTAHDVGTVTLAPQAYCQVHYLVARAGHDSPGLPSALDMVDVSLHVEGTYRAPDATTDTAFTIHTASAYGQLFARVGNPPTALHADTGTIDLAVEVRRRRSRLFDGVDFAHMPVKTVALRMLQALVDGAEVEVGPIHAEH
jgi:hypothetical protein